MKFKFQFELFFLMLIPFTSIAAKDIPGSKDLSDIGRYQDSEIIYYDAKEYDATTFATGPVQKESDAENTSLYIEGKITRIIYKIPKNRSALEVFRNFENKAKDSGYNVSFSGTPKDIKSYSFKYQHPVEIPDKTSLGDDIYYAYAIKDSENNTTKHLSINVSPHSGGDGVRVRIIEAEIKKMEQRMVDAAEMQKQITDSGHVALYGIYFDFDKATLKPESKPTLDEISSLLTSNPDLKLILVGHTDILGGYDYNMTLSKLRANAVVDSLIKNYNISSGRLMGAGVGYLSPAASNDTDEGRAKNRRVELIKNY